MCALCGRPGAPLYRQLRDRLFDVTGTWSLLRCTGCALVWLDPRPSPDEVADLYRSYYTHDATEDGTEPSPRDVPTSRSTRPGPVASWFEQAVTRGIATTRLGFAARADTGLHDRSAESLLARGLLQWIGPLREIAEHGVMWLPGGTPGRLLDVGCGAGAFLARMQDLGWQVFGVEPDPTGARATRKKLGRDGVVAADIGACELPVASFDAITLSHVIEHLPDPGDTLRACRRLLKPGGTLVCATPNTGGLGARSFGEHWLHWDPPRHLQLYDPETLTRQIQEAGFDVRRVATPSSSAHFVWQASTLLERRGRLPDIDLSGISPSLVAESIGFWAWEYALTRLGRRCGEEVLVIAELAPGS